MKNRLTALVLIAMATSAGFAFGQAQQSPIPENPGVQPQIDILGSGIATLDFANQSGFGTSGFATNGSINLSDSALAAGFSERLFRGGIGSFVAGVQSYDFTNVGAGSGLFTNQMFLDFQNKASEVYLGRTDSPTGQLVQFPTLRGDDLVDFTMVPDPFSNGQNIEENRTSNVAAVVLNQGLRTFENFHVQHLIDSAGLGTGTDLNSFGASYQYAPVPGLESLPTLVSYGIGYEHRSIPNAFGGGSDAIYGGGEVNLRRSITNRLDFRVFDAYTFGNSTNSISSFNDSYRADANAIAASIRYLNSPFGKPSYTLALTAGYKSFQKISGANEFALAFTAAKRLGPGFDAIGQIGWFHRNGALAALYGAKDSTVLQLGLSFNFDSTIHQSIGPRRSPMNILYHYLPN